MNYDIGMFGFYDSPDQRYDQPTYDPGQNVPCLLCGEPWAMDTVRTHSIMPAIAFEGRCSWFWRSHRDCHDRWQEDHPGEDFSPPEAWLDEYLARTGQVQQ